jgi:hypothetical protein
MIQDTEVDQALRHVREFGGNSSVRAILAHALEPHAMSKKHELRAISMGCGDDHVASSIERTLQQGGWTPASH